VKDKEKKLNQRRFFFWYKKENHAFIRKSMEQAGRSELADELIGKEKAGGRVPKWLEEKRKNQLSRSGKSKK
jgi:hypothetical protein